MVVKRTVATTVACCVFLPIEYVMVVKRTVATTVACCVFLPSTKTITVKVIVHILVDGKKTQHATVRFTTITYSRSEDKTV